MFCVTLTYPTSVLTLFFVLARSIANYFRGIGLEVEEHYAKWDLSEDYITVIAVRLRNNYSTVCQAARQLNNCFRSILLVAIINIFVQIVAHSYLIDWALHNNQPEMVAIPYNVSMIIMLLVYLFAITYAVDFMTGEESNLIPVLRYFTLLKKTTDQDICQLMNEIGCPTWKITAAGCFAVNRGLIIQF